MTRIRTRYHGPRTNVWTGVRDWVRWLLRLPLRLLHRRDRHGLRVAMEQLSPKLLSAEAAIYWVYPLSEAARPALGGMREPTTAVLEQLPPTHRYVILNLRESEIPVPYALPDTDRDRVMRFPIPSGTLPEQPVVRELFQDIAASIDEPAALPPALLIHCKEGVSRTPQMLCAWLIWREGRSSDEAVTRVQKAQEAAGVYMFVPDGRERGWLRAFAE